MAGEITYVGISGSTNQTQVTVKPTFSTSSTTANNMVYVPKVTSIRIYIKPSTSSSYWNYPHGSTVSGTSRTINETFTGSAAYTMFFKVYFTISRYTIDLAYIDTLAEQSKNSSTLTLSMKTAAPSKTPTFSSITTSGATVSWGATYGVSKITYSIDGSSTWSTVTPTAGSTSGTFNVSGLSDGVQHNVAYRTYDRYRTSTYSTSAKGYFTTVAIPPTSCSAPTLVYIISNTPTDQRTVPGSTFKLYWSGASGGTKNAISTYEVQQLISGGSWTAVGTTSGTSMSITTPSNRGKSVSYRVRTRGTAGADYYSGYKLARNELKVNQLPNTPIISASEAIVPSTGGDVEIIPTGQGDPDGGTVTLYVGVHSTGTGRSIWSGAQTLSITTPTTYYVWAKDDLEEYSSSYSSVSIAVNTKPIVNSITVSKANWGGGTNYSFANVLSANGSYNKTPSTYQWKYRTSSSTNFPDVGTDLTTSSTLSNKDMTSVITTKGNYYQIGLQVADTLESSNLKWSSTFRIPKLPSAATINGVYNDPTAAATITGTTSTNFKEKVTIKYTIPALADGQLEIKEATIQVLNRDTNGPLTITVLAEKTPKVYTLNNFNVAVNRGQTVKFKIVVKDLSDTIAEYTFSTTYRHIEIPTFVSNTPDISRYDFKPLSGKENFNIITPETAKAGGANGSFKWHCKLSISGIEINLDDILGNPTYNNNTHTNTFNLSYTSFYNELSLSDLNKNFKHVGGNFLVYLTNEFGDASTIQLSLSPIKIDYQEAPEFPSQASLTLGVLYIPSNTPSEALIPTTEDTGIYINNNRMVNPNEAVVLNFDKATDLNGIDDITKYQLFIKQFDDRPASLDYNETSPTSHVLVREFNASELINNPSNSEKAYLKYILPAYDTNKFIVFSLVAKDSTGLTSSTLYSNTYLIGCRVDKPTIEIKEQKRIDDGESIQFKIAVSDLGGSRFNNPDYKYDAIQSSDSYPNLERSFTGYNPKAFLKVWGSKNGEFLEEDAENTENAFYQKITLTDNPLYPNYSSFKSIEGVNFDASADFVGGITTSFYFKVQLVLSVGLEEIGSEIVTKTIETETPVLMFYIEEATVAYRKNQVGINTSELENGNALTVSSYKEQNTIVLKGVTDTGPIIIDLNTKEIIGIIINGGSWG